MCKRKTVAAVLFLAALMVLPGCGTKDGDDVMSYDPSYEMGLSESDSAALDAAFIDEAELGEVEIVDIEDEALALAASPPTVPTYLTTSAPGINEKRNSKAVIDYSNIKDGYVMVNFTTQTSKKLKALVTGPTTKYQYNITQGKWTVLPLSDGNGTYKVTVYENVKGNSYASVLSQSVNVTLTDEFAPFLRSNQYVDFEAAPNSIAKAQELCADMTDPLKKVEAVYSFVVDNLTYDKQKAATVQSGYLPVLDDVLAAKKGICFDYAALMTGMLRSQGVPCKLVVGYAGTAYHAWISVWSEADGWIDGAIYFNGSTWQRMDPTFASSGKQSQSVMKYIGDGKNYSSKYFY